MIGIMAPYSTTAAVLLVLITCVGIRQEAGFEFSSIDGRHRTERARSRADQPQPDEIRVTGYGAGYGGLAHAGMLCAVRGLPCSR